MKRGISRPEHRFGLPRPLGQPEARYSVMKAAELLVRSNLSFGHGAGLTRRSPGRPGERMVGLIRCRPRPSKDVFRVNEIRRSRRVGDNLHDDGERCHEAEMRSVRKSQTSSCVPSSTTRSGGIRK